MEEVTLILVIASFLAYVFSLKVSSRTTQMFTLVLSVCAVSAVAQDGEIADNIMYLIMFPLLTVALFTIGSLCILKGAN